MRTVKTLMKNQNGFVHYLAIVAIAGVLIAAVYFAFAHRLLNISLTGTLVKSTCSSGNSCNPYSVASGNKTYGLDKLTSLPPAVAPGQTVNVTGTTSPSSSSVTVQTITGVKSPTPKATPVPSPSQTSSPAATAKPATFPSDVSFSSVVNGDTCSQVDNPGGPPVGDVGCSISTANGWTVRVRRGNTFSSTAPGQLLGAPDYNQTWKGHTVTVFAQATSADQATILTASTYYVKF